MALERLEERISNLIPAQMDRQVHFVDWGVLVLCIVGIAWRLFH